MKTVSRIDDLRRRCDAARAEGAEIGFVPTMGSLHEGHRSLLRAARADTDVVVASIFVNSLQFGPGEDLAAYPRDLDTDSAMADDDGVDLLFVPSSAEMYPTDPLTTVHVSGLTHGLCGASRPTFFDGVATVVTKLLSIVGPCRAYLGRKDYQQLAVVKRLVADLDLPVEVVGCPLVREPDGVAMSSRNAYLDGDTRARATVLYEALSSVADAVREGERNARLLRDRLADLVSREPALTLDYADVVDATTLAPVSDIEGEIVVAVAADAAGARLIDNMTILVDGGEVTVDAGVLVAAA